MKTNCRLASRSSKHFSARAICGARLRQGFVAQPSLSLVFRAKVGGGERDRTDDLLRARQALSQLSYTPTEKLVGLTGLEPVTSRLSGVRSNRN